MPSITSSVPTGGAFARGASPGSDSQNGLYQANQKVKDAQKAQQDWLSQQGLKTSDSGQLLTGNVGANSVFNSLNSRLKSAQGEASEAQNELDQGKIRSDALQPIQSQADLMSKQASDFQQAMPSIGNNTMALNRTNARRQLASDLQTNNAKYNQRGLLYSGMRAGGAADASTNTGNDLADKQAAVNKQLQDSQNTLNQNAVQAQQALTAATQNFNNSDANYRQNLLNAVLQQAGANQQILGGLIGAGGQLAGKVVGAALPSKTA